MLDCFHGEKVSPSVYKYAVYTAINLHCLLNKCRFTSMCADKLHLISTACVVSHQVVVHLQMVQAPSIHVLDIRHEKIISC